jgi:uncharacterized membrane protein YecN with MAPEG domain
VVSGRIEPASASYRTLTEPIQKAATSWVPVLLRIFVIAVAAVEIAQSKLWAAGVLVLLLAVGVAGRIAAMALLVVTGLVITSSGLTPARTALLVGTVALMFTGSGALSLWQPEDAFLRWRAGE